MDTPQKQAVAVKQTNVLAIQGKIHTIRGQQVILDFDLAMLYGVKTMRLNEAVKRNIKRFPADFMFQLTKQEAENLISQFAISSWGGTRKLPYAFTEQGVAMLSGLLNSDIAIDVNIAIMRAFVFVRQYALSHKDLTEKLKALEEKYDQKFNTIHEALNYLLQKDKREAEQLKREAEQRKRKQIGFHP